MLLQLFKKELRLQQSSFFFALAIVLVWGLLLLLAVNGERPIAPGQLTMAQLAGLLQLFFIAPCLLIIVPLFVGAAMVAEERKLGVWDWQLSLPAPRTGQWLIKLALGAAITLVMPFFIQPLLDLLLFRLLESHGYVEARFIPASLLHLNKSYPYLPLLLMVSGAFVSSMVYDPYRAFFGGLVVFILALACTRLTDPASLMFQQWGQLKFFEHPILLTSNLGPAHILALCAIVAWLAWFNFRHEAFRRRRFIMQLFAMIALISAATALVLDLGFSPRRLLSQSRDDVQPYILAERANLGYESAPINWTGIEPLLVKKARPLGVSPQRWLEFQNREPFIGGIFRLPNRLFIELNSFPSTFLVPRVGSYNQPRIEHSLICYNQFIAFDMATHRFRSIHQLVGEVNDVIVETSSPVIQNLRQHPYLITECPIPFRLGGIAWNFWKQGRPLTYANSAIWGADAGIADRQLLVNEKMTRFQGIKPLDPNHGLFEINVPSDSNPVWLIRRNPANIWQLIDKQSGYNFYSVSSDGRWFARKGIINRNFDGPLNQLTLYSIDHTTTWTLASSQGNLLLHDYALSFRTFSPLGTRKDGLMQVSPSGRYLSYKRTKTIKYKENNGVLLETGYPEQVEIGVLDLQSGQQFPLLQATPERKYQLEFKKSMQELLWEKWRRESGGLREWKLFRFPEDFPGQNYQESFPPLAWAPGHDKIAILHDGMVHLFQYLPDWRKGLKFPSQHLEAMGDFAPTGIIDLIGFQIDNLDFWDPDTLLVWGKLGLFKINLNAPGARWSGGTPHANG